MAEQRDLGTILRNASETLESAKLGCQDLDSDDPRRRMAGLRNLVVFGRAMTNVLQTLRSVVGKQEFDDWYLPIQSEMRDDPLLRFFYELRSKILKEGATGTGASLSIDTLNTNDIDWASAPPGAKSFFLGDQIGGNGWEVELADGSVEKFYVSLPGAIKATTTLHFEDSPESHLDTAVDPQATIQEVAKLYVAYLDGVVGKAKAQFPVS